MKSQQNRIELVTRPEAEVPVCEEVQSWWRSVVTTFRSPEDPEL